jgi:predicted esterase
MTADGGAPDLGFLHRWEPRDGASRTLLLLHGTGGDENDLIPLGDMIDPAANLLSPRGPVLENGMPRFFRRLAEGVFDLDDLRARARQLATFIEAASAEYGFDRAGLTALGFSNGANIAGAVMLLHPEALRSAILLRAMVPLTPDAKPDLHGARVYVGAGEADPIIPPAESERLASMLRDYGATVTMDWLPVGHQLSRGDVDGARAWLRAR